MHADDAAGPPAPTRRRDLWVGTYPAAGAGTSAGRGEGIWRLSLDERAGTLTGALAATSPAPSFLALHPEGTVLYAVGETAPGTVTCFAVTADGLEPREQVRAGGDSPCHLLVGPGARALYVSSYASGTVAVLPLAADGGFSAAVRGSGGPVQVFGGSGAGPHPDRQEGPHAHSTLLAPGGEHLLVLDLGTDELRAHRITGDGLLEPARTSFDLAPGTGPRHAAVGPGDHLYVVGELSATVDVLHWDRASATASHRQTLPACAAQPVSDSPRYPAHLVVRDDTVLVSVRGADVVAELTVHDGGARLEHRQDLDVGGAWPRHFAVVDPGDRDGPTPDLPAATHIVSAVQGAGLVTVLRRGDGEAGAPLVDRFAVPQPACVLPGL